MDRIIEEADNCGEFIYSEDYIGYFVRYDNDLQGVYDVIKPECINLINSQFLVAYKRAPEPEDLEGFFQYGYSSLPKCFGLMDMSVLVETGTDKVRGLAGLSLTGQDVLFGFVDTGIDYINPVFKDELGNTRIDYIWDQTEEVVGTGPAVFGYGAEYYNDDINRAIKSEEPYLVVPSRDLNGHGTFLASLAAGGVDREKAFSGIAPNGRIAMVKLKPAKRNIKDFYLINEEAECYSEEDIILGIKYLINKAIESAMPLVICIGLGTNQGDHNGTTNLELYLETIVNLRGICVVAAGGNELGARSHFAGGSNLYTGGGQEPVEISVASEDRGFSMEIWGNAPGLLRINIVSPTGERLNTVVPTETGGTYGEFLYEGSSVFVQNIVVESTSGDQVIFLRFDRPGPGIWTINVSETINQIGRGFDAWLPIREFKNKDTVFIRANPDITLCSPGNSRGAITVAGYNHYNNSLYANSGRGYTRKGRIKPNFVAPSVDVYGAFLGGGGQETLFSRRSGTSVGTAITAGVAGLILQWAIVDRNNLGINTEVIKQMLIRGARREGDITYPNNSWGWGILDVFGAFEAMRRN